MTEQICKAMQKGRVLKCTVIRGSLMCDTI